MEPKPWPHDLQKIQTYNQMINLDETNSMQKELSQVSFITPQKSKFKNHESEISRAMFQQFSNYF